MKSLRVVADLIQTGGRKNWIRPYGVATGAAVAAAIAVAPLSCSSSWQG